MFYSLFSLLFPIWIIFQNKKLLFHNKKTELKNEIIDLDLENIEDNNEKILFIKHTNNKQKYTGFDLTKNKSFVEKNDEMQKITNYFRKLKQLRFLESPFVSNIMKHKCAEEILKDLDENDKNDKKNSFWETYEDIYF